MKHKVQVVMLPTEDRTNIIINKGFTPTSLLQYRPDLREASDFLRSGWANQHLYITVSQDVELIKEGDPFIENGMYLSLGDSKPSSDTYIPRNNRKIIATTDPKLTKSSNWVEADVMGHWECTNCKGWTELIEDRTCKCTPVAQLQQSFIKEYVTNPAGEWEVEYDVFLEMNDLRGKYTEYSLKLNQDNTINITSVEEKMYSLEQMQQAFAHGKSVGTYLMSNLGKKFAPLTFNSWLDHELKQ